VAHVLGRMDEGAREAARPVAVVLQEVQRHSLRRFRPYAWQAAQRFRERIEAGHRLEGGNRGRIA
jgi:hypothetical protein